MENIGNRIKEIRKYRKVTQEILSQKVGVNRSLLSKIERGHSPGSLRTLTKLADALGVSITALLRDRAKRGN